MEFRQNDEYLVCDECGKQCMYGDCPHHGPLEWIDDNHSVSGAQQKNQARATLPSNLYLMPSAVGQGQMGVFTRARIEKRVMFGPFKGTNISAKEFNCGEHHNYMYMWDILEGGKVSHIVDGSDEQSSNWMRFVNCARDSKEQNLVAVQFRGEIYYKTCNPVESGSELLVWYDDSLSLESSAMKEQSGHDFVCDACGLSFAGSTFLLKHKSVRCKETPADHGSSAEDQEDQADKPMESSDNAALSTDAELTYVVIPIEATCNEDNTQASISCDQEVQADVPGESSETAKTNQEDDTLLCDTDSPYVVHIGTPSCENSTTVVEENSSFCIVHVRPVPSSEVSNTRRLRKGKQGTAPVVNGKTPKLTNTRKRSIESVGKAKQITRKSALSKARKTPSKGTKAQNVTPKKSVTASAGTKRNATSSDVSKPQVKRRKVTQPKESQGRKKAKKGKGSSMRENTKNKAAEDESMGDNGAEKQLPKARKKSKKSCNLKSSSLGEEEGTVSAAEDGRADKRPRKKTPRKTRTGTAQETDEDRIDPSTTPSPTKRRRNSPKEKLTFTCEQCLRTFKWKSQLDYHMRSHANEKEFKCTFCDKGLSQLSSLKRHLRVHSGEKPFECDECGKRFVEKGKLTVHLRTHAGHPPEKKYKCSVCDRGFTLSANLRTHVRTHTGEKPYPCPQCGKGFKRSSDIISHLRSHTGERPYKCSHCPKAFTMISHRNRHELTHSGKRPFKCDLCGKRFTQANSVKAHLNVHARKQARLEGRGIAEERQETSRDEEMLADEQHVLNEAQRNGLQETGVATGEGHRTEELQGVITQLMETEHVQEDSSHAHNHKIDGAQLLQLGDSSGVDGLVEQEISSRDGTELRTIATEQLQLSCTTDSSSEQLNIDNTLINGKELLQLGSATQVDSAGHQQVELAPSNVQEQVQLAEGNETTLLAL